MDSIEFNKIDKIDDRINILKSLTLDEKVNLLESQLNNVYKYWNDSILKTNSIIENFTGSLEEKIIDYDLMLSKASWINKKVDYPNEEPDLIYQWSIFNCELGYNIGSEQNKTRPVLVLNNTNFIKSSIVIVAPITGNGKRIYDHEVKLLETAYSKVTGKVDLSHIRAVSKSRLSKKPIDRLLNSKEYSSKYAGVKFTMIQETIKNRLTQILGIDI